MSITEWDTDDGKLLFEAGPPTRRQATPNPREDTRRVTAFLSAPQRRYLREVAHHLGQASDRRVAISGLLRAILSAVVSADLDYANCESLQDLEKHLLQGLTRDHHG